MKFYFILFATIIALGTAALAQKTEKKIEAKTVTATKPQSSPTQTVAQLTPDAKAVRAAFDKLVKGINDSDVEAVTSVYQNSPTTLYFNNNGSITRGWEQDKANRQARYPKTTNVKLIPTNVKIEMLGTAGALLTCQWTQTQDYEGKPEAASGRMTLVFKKIGKDWKIIHLHTSPDKPDVTRPIFNSERLPN
jgi:ketosteroid isomerase-like protein